ncbi:MAG: U32 family peptidase [Clostridia bacterium]|nr:U32 family peptidase [Clostridia bacterium]
MEILSPAGSMEALVAAVRSGADAVYLGGKNLNARRNAGNFDAQQLKEAAEYCHGRNVKLYLTLNTLVSDEELDTAIDMIKTACIVGADALIVQDLGLARIAHDIAPDMPLHASTQMSLQTSEGIKMLSNLNFKRVVLPRELTKEELVDIVKNSPIETEVFVHGALCMSVSGQCYMSSMLGGRSGNRGLCAQPCRLSFATEGKTGNYLSLKDLSLVDRLRELREIGVASVKIEGRMKRPEYVAAAVKSCRQALDSQLDSKLYFDLKSVFSRSGFTSGYYDKKFGSDMFGIRTKEDVVAASSVLKNLAQLYKDEAEKIPVELAFTAVRNENVSLSAKAMGKQVFVSSDFIPQDALTKPLDEDSAEMQLKKTGGTQFFVDDIYMEIDEGINVPVSVINKLRRAVLEELDKKISEKTTAFYDEKYFVKPYKSGRQKRYTRFDNAKQVPKNIKTDLIILPLDTDDETLKNLSEKYDVAVEIPRGIFGTDKKINERLKNCPIKKAVASTLDAYALAKNNGYYVIAGFGSNIYNSKSLEELEKMGVSEALLSTELLLSQISRLGGSIKRGIISYGRIPLMLTRNCPIKNGKTCAECKRESNLIDRKGIEFPVRCTNGFAEILNSRPIVLSDRKSELRNIDFSLLYFTTETAEECERIMSDYDEEKKANGEFTRGLYYRGVE